MPICDIFNQSISQGTFPDDWKYARVTPLYKQGDRGDVNNYRPISVIPIVAKVFEKIVYEQLYAYLEAHDILCQNQSGFRANHSTVTALLEATDSWAYNIDIFLTEISEKHRGTSSKADSLRERNCWKTDDSFLGTLIWVLFLPNSWAVYSNNRKASTLVRSKWCLLVYRGGIRLEESWMSDERKSCSFS